MALVKCKNCNLILTEAATECPGCGVKLQTYTDQSHEVQSAVTRARKLLQCGKLADAEIIAINASHRYHATCESLALLADICALKGETKKANEYRAQAESLRAADEVQAEDDGARAATLRLTPASWGMLAVIVFVMLSAVTTFVLYQSGNNTTGRAGIIHVMPPEVQPLVTTPSGSIKEPVMATTTAAPPVRNTLPVQPVVVPEQERTSTVKSPVTSSTTTTTVTDAAKPNL